LDIAVFGNGSVRSH